MGSNLLSKKQEETWKTLAHSDRKKVASSLVLNMESTGFEIASVMDQEQSVVAADENLCKFY